MKSSFHKGTDYFLETYQQSHRKYDITGETGSSLAMFCTMVILEMDLLYKTKA